MITVDFIYKTVISWVLYFPAADKNFVNKSDYYKLQYYNIKIGLINSAVSNRLASLDIACRDVSVDDSFQCVDGGCLWYHMISAWSGQMP